MLYKIQKIQQQQELINQMKDQQQEQMLQQKEGQKFCTVSQIKGFAYKKKNGIMLTQYPSVGILFFLKNNLRFYDGDVTEDIHTTQNPISTITVRGSMAVVGEQLYKGQLTTTTIINLKEKYTQSLQYQKSQTQLLALSSQHKYLCSVGAPQPEIQQLFLIHLQHHNQSGIKVIHTRSFQVHKHTKIVDVSFASNKEQLLGVLWMNKFVLMVVEVKALEEYPLKTNKVREFSLMTFHPADTMCYLSSKNGDICEVDVKLRKQVRVGPAKRVIISGIKHIRYLHPNHLIITGVKGFIALVEVSQLRVVKQLTMNEQIISLTEFYGGVGFLSTQKASIYLLDGSNLSIKPFYTAHNAPITKITFMQHFNDVFGTCCGSQLVLWNTESLQPVLKVDMVNRQCLCLDLIKNGTSLISGWSDGIIRFFSPTTGKLLSTIPSAHTDKVTAIISNPSSEKLFSGGENGLIRVWKLQSQHKGRIQTNLLGHHKQIHHLLLKHEYLYSCCEGGFYTVWNINKYEKLANNCVNNFLKQVQPFDHYTLLGIGSGGVLYRFRKNDGVMVEELEVGGAHLNCFYTLKNQMYDDLYFFGGDMHQLVVMGIRNMPDQTVVLWREACPTYSQITALTISPNHDKAVVGTADGYLITFDLGQINHRN